MYNNYEKALILLELLEPYIEEESKLFKAGHKKSEDLLPTLKIDDTDSMLKLEACVLETKKHQINYNNGKKIISDIKEAYKECRSKVAIFRKKALILSIGSCTLQSIFDSEECKSILKELAYRYYEQGIFNEFIVEGSLLCPINMSMYLESLFAQNLLTKEDYIFYHTFIIALLNSEQFKEHNKTFQKQRI